MGVQNTYFAHPDLVCLFASRSGNHQWVSSNTQKNRSLVRGATSRGSAGRRYWSGGGVSGRKSAVIRWKGAATRRRGAVHPPLRRRGAVIGSRKEATYWSEGRRQWLEGRRFCVRGVVTGRRTLLLVGEAMFLVRDTFFFGGGGLLGFLAPKATLHTPPKLRSAATAVRSTPNRRLVLR